MKPFFRIINDAKGILRLLKNKYLLGKRLQPGLYVILYHHIKDRSKSTNELGVSCYGELGIEKVTTSRRHFLEHLDYYEKNFRIISLAKAIELLNNSEGKLERPYLTLTFDDGYRSFGEQVYPILRKHGLPATIFLNGDPVLNQRGLARLRLSKLCTDHTNTVLSAFNQQFLPSLSSGKELFDYYKDAYQTDFDDFIHQKWNELVNQTIQSSEMEFYLDKDDLSNFDSSLVSFGSHTYSHGRLSSMTEKRQKKEINDCHRQLESELEQQLDFFAYPFGRFEHYDEISLKLVKSLDGVWALTTEPRIIHELNEREIPRIAIGEKSSIDLQLQLYNTEIH